MDPVLAAQMGKAVAEKVLQYRRDESGWKTCREAVSGPPGRGPFGPQAPPRPAASVRAKPLALD